MSAEPRSVPDRTALLRTILGGAAAQLPVTLDGQRPVININITFSGDGPMTLIIGSPQELSSLPATITGASNDP